MFFLPAFFVMSTGCRTGDVEAVCRCSCRYPSVFPFDYYPFCSGRAAARLEAGGADKKAGKEQAARNMK